MKTSTKVVIKAYSVKDLISKISSYNHLFDFKPGEDNLFMHAFGNVKLGGNIVYSLRGHGLEVRDRGFVVLDGINDYVSDIKGFLTVTIIKH